MSGFYASNNRIRVIPPGDTDPTFDTEEGMPHIVGTAVVNNKTVAFNNLTQTMSYAAYDACAYYQIAWYYTCELVYVPGYYTYELAYIDGYCETTYSYEYVYWYEYVCDYVSGYDYYYGSYYYYYDCGYEQVGGYQLVSNWECYVGYFTYELVFVPSTYDWQCSFDSGYECVGVTYYQYDIDAREYSATEDLVALPLDETGNSVPVDFMIIQATGSRTVGGTDPQLDISFLTTVPSKTFSFQGSVLLEAAGRKDGSSWFRRILSVVVESGKVKLKRQESVGNLNGDSSFSTSNASTFNFNFKIFFGRFK